jgi:hypothetical protein
VQHDDRLDTMGFGLCKTCADTAKKRRAEKRASMFAKRAKFKR